MSVRQLTIPIELNALCDFASFEVGGNGETLHALEELARSAGAAGAWLWGPRGSGKSHLLQASCQAGNLAGRRCLYVPLAALGRDPGILEGLQADLLALDDADAWLGELELEAELVGAYQRQLARGGALVCAAPAAPTALSFALPDLASRCRGLSCYALAPLDDEGLKAVLCRKARQRGLKLSAATLDFWLARSRRALPALLGELDLIDRAALAGKRRVTIPLLKEVLRL